jgi:cytochrome c5
MDLFLLVISVLVGVSFGIFLLTKYIASQTQEIYRVQDDVYQEQVLARIAPIGKVAIEGEAVAASDSAAAISEPEPVAAALSGPQVYNSACLACHGAGIGGAPATGNKEQWAARIAQNAQVLQDHVINGYQGNNGYMPPKGGRVDLSDEEILAAMNYMIDQVR